MPPTGPDTAIPGRPAADLRPAGRDPSDRRNRGRGAAAQNRSALVAAAREVFADAGYDAPLSSVARRAGVGQGSLYRHFPDRVSLALAAFEENVSELEALADRPGTTVEDCLSLLAEQSIAAVAYIHLLSGRADDPRVAAVAQRVTAVLAATLPEAQQAGRLGRHLDASDLLMAVGMVSGLLTQVPAAGRRATAGRAWALLHRALVP